jgi:hypothetical protein
VNNIKPVTVLGVPVEIRSGNFPHTCEKRYHPCRFVRHLDVNGKVILKWTLNKCGVRLWTGFVYRRIKIHGCLL